ncbi:MAG: hypothetical protein A2Z16_10065 [Chloroflexi bacterium RBG_16_54_18]|nr:MAG: hypothetical protein A2Z16_10065 [Chloroflexi bacterium RBG_16_54_18]
MRQTAEEAVRVSVSHSVWTLVRLRWMIFLIGFRRASRVRKLVVIFIFLISLGGIGVIILISRYLLTFLKNPLLAEGVGNLDAVLNSIPNVLITGAFIGILVTSFGVLLQALYLAGDMDFLLSRPVPIRAVFITKLLQAVLPSFILICAIALPIMFGLGLAQGYSLLFYPLVLLELVVLSLAAAGFSSLLVMAVVRVIPARRVAEIIGFTGATLSFLCSQSGQLARLDNLSPGDLSQVLVIFQRFDSPLSPLYWAGLGLVGVGNGDWLNGIGLVAITVFAAGGIFGVSLVTAEKLYYSGWASMQVRVQKAKQVRREKSGISVPRIALIERLISPAAWAVTIKDWTVIRRDIRNMSQLITPLIFGIIYAVMFLRGGRQVPVGRGEAPAWFMDLMGGFVVYANIGLSLFVGWMLLGRLAGMAFSQEGKNYWLLKTSPIKPVELVTAKYLVSFLPVLALGWGFLVAIMLIQRESLGLLLYSMVVVAFSICGNAGINLAFGIAGARLDWEDPRQMQRGSMSCLGALVSMVYLVSSLILFFAAPFLAEILGLPEAFGQTIGLLVGCPFCLACAVIPLWLVRQRVEFLGEAKV